MKALAINPKPTTRGMTVIELLIVMLIIGGLSYSASIAVRWSRDRALFAKFMSEMRQFKMAAQRFEQDVGYFPPDVWRGVDPGLIEKDGWKRGGHSAQWDTLNLSGWKGPYLEKWPASPWGGLYDWDNYAPGYDYMGIPGGAVYITLKPTSWGGKGGLPKPDFEEMLQERGIDKSSWTYCIAVRMGSYSASD